MIRDEAFWTEEEKAVILSLNAGFVNHDNAETHIERVKSWVDLVEKTGKVDVTMVDSCPDPASDRIFKLDAVRTFSSEARQKEYVTTLCSIWHQMKDYAQGMGYLVAILSLFLSPEEIVRICLKCDTDEKYIPGYWRLAPAVFQREGRVYQKLFDTRYPALAAHVKKYTVAEAYAQKYLVGMNVHVLPFKYLMDYLEGFFTHGYEHAFKFSLALLEVMEDELMAAKGVEEVMQILRLDKARYPPVCPKEGEEDTSVFARIMDRMGKIEISEDLDALRAEAQAQLDLEKERRRLREEQLLKEMEDDSEDNFTDED